LAHNAGLFIPQLLTSRNATCKGEQGYTGSSSYHNHTPELNLRARWRCCPHTAKPPPLDLPRPVWLGVSTGVALPSLSSTPRSQPPSSYSSSRLCSMAAMAPERAVFVEIRPMRRSGCGMVVRTWGCPSAVTPSWHEMAHVALAHAVMAFPGRLNRGVTKAARTRAR
jgi:hypothetical protein